MDDQEAPQSHTPDLPYGRVTDAARFAMLHSVALDLLNRLHDEFDVDRVEPYGNDEDFQRLTRAPLARPTVALIPRDGRGAPLIVAFSSFPGLLVRVGSCYRLAFPGCGCDACNESGEGEADRFQRLVLAVTAGRFREYLERRGDDQVTIVWEWESNGQHWREQQLLPSADASGVDLTSLPHWKPWTGR
jgi:hypothetical protein